MTALVFIVPGYLILYYIFKLYTPEESTREKTGSLACHSGKCDWDAGVHPGFVSAPSDEFFANDDLRIFLCECYT